MRRVLLIQHARGRLIDSREAALPLRLQIEEALAVGGDVVLDFSGGEVTQGFVAELIGTLILQRGPDVLEQIVFKSCSEEARAIIELVAADIADRYVKAHSH